MWQEEEIQPYLEKYNINHLHYMTHIDNILSIQQKGILCHNLVGSTSHCQIDNTDVQQIRAQKKVPYTNNTLHSYVPLYFATHTPMQYVVTQGKDAVIKEEDLVFIDLDPLKIFQMEGVTISDGNSAHQDTSFYHEINGLDKLNWDVIATPNCYSKTYKRQKMAEVLVPRLIPVNCFSRIVCKSKQVGENIFNVIHENLEQLPVETQKHLKANVKIHINPSPSYYY